MNTVPMLPGCPLYRLYMRDRYPTTCRPHSTTAVLGVIFVVVQVCGLGLALGFTIQPAQAPTCCAPCPQAQSTPVEGEKAEGSASAESLEATTPVAAAEIDSASPAVHSARFAAPAPATPVGEAEVGAVDGDAEPAAAIPLLRRAPKTSPPSTFAARA